MKRSILYVILLLGVSVIGYFAAMELFPSNDGPAPQKEKLANTEGNISTEDNKGLDENSGIAESDNQPMDNQSTKAEEPAPEVEITSQATVVEQPVWHNKTHTFEAAIRGVASNSYAAVAKSGEVNVVLDIGREATGGHIALQSYHASQKFLDYGIFISMDRDNWTAVFDTKMSDTSNRREIKKDISTYNLDDLGAFKYIKLNYRESAGQNRLLLKKMQIFVRQNK